MSLRDQVKQAVKTAYASTQDLWFDVEFRRYQDHEYDPQNPEDSGMYISEYCEAVEKEYKSYQIDGTRVQSGDRLIYIDFDDLSDVGLEDDVIIDNVKYNVVSYQPIQQDVLWEVHLRRGG